ncbi:MAG: segregation and condensation protein A [Sulfuriflexus sp.]|nr:segregation and condensation protein A [Sulfuriflexus sp.]
MSDEQGQENSADKEMKVLRAVKMVITNVIKDTTTEPGMKHPLSNETITDIRQCLGLITARENELSPMMHRPRFTDEPEKVVVSLATPKKDK